MRLAAPGLKAPEAPLCRSSCATRFPPRTLLSVYTALGKNRPRRETQRRTTLRPDVGRLSRSGAAFPERRAGNRARPGPRRRNRRRRVGFREKLKDHRVRIVALMKGGVGQDELAETLFEMSGRADTGASESGRLRIGVGV